MYGGGGDIGIDEDFATRSFVRDLRRGARSNCFSVPPSKAVTVNPIFLVPVAIPAALRRSGTSDQGEFTTDLPALYLTVLSVQRYQSALFGVNVKSPSRTRVPTDLLVVKLSVSRSPRPM